MSKLNIVCLPGDGIGPEVTRAMKAVVEAAQAHVEWIDMPAGLSAIESHGVPLPQETLDAIRTHRLAIKGPTGTPKGEGHSSVNVALRQQLDLHAGLRPYATQAFLAPLGQGIDLLLFRQNTEGMYACDEETSPDGRNVTLTARFSAEAMERLARRAFETARKLGRKRVTLLTKANIHKGWGKLYLDAFYRIAASYGGMAADDLLVDAAAMMLVTRPERFDVVITENMQGDILSDLCAGLIGGLGVAPGANIGDECAVFEAVHGTADDIAGRDLANPTALILSSAMLFDHLGEKALADRIRRAVRAVQADTGFTTGDLRRYYPATARVWSTSAFTEEVCAAVRCA